MLHSFRRRDCGSMDRLAAIRRGSTFGLFRFPFHAHAVFLQQIGSQNLVLPLRVSSPMASYTAPTSHAEKLDDIMQKLTQFQTTNPTKMDSCARVIALESCSSSSSHTATPSSSPLAFSTDVVIKSLHLTQPLLLPLPLFNRNH
ncbi:hypothetical protein JHK87_055959 [Glycine soja]|nr:hypothetical protein JHK87_055959 [Glycine soja]